MNLLSDIITYVRRLVKTPSNASLSDNLVIDYINRFWLMDVDARIQLFDLKTSYNFQTIPGIADYNMPLYNLQTEPGSQSISYYPVYQGFMAPCFVNGIQVPFYTERNSFWNLWPNYVQALNIATTGNGTAGPYTISLPQFPAIPGHLDMTGVIAAGYPSDPLFASTLSVSSGTPVIPYSSIHSAVWFTATDQNGNNMTVQDSGVFLSGNTSSDLYGLLITQNVASNAYGPQYPTNYQIYNSYSTTSNTVNYTSGTATVTFPNIVPSGNAINVECFYYQPGLPRAVLFNNNTLTVRPPPNISYTVDLTCYLTPAAFLSTGQAVQFAYMSEYIARGAARKILSDTGDWEQFMAYEALFKEQETLVWKRSQRQITANRTPTIFSEFQGPANYNQIGAGS